MFDIMPFGHVQRNLWNVFDNMEKMVTEMPEMIKGFRADVVDAGDKYVMEAELPGFAKEDIKLSIEGDYLTIHAEHSEEVNKEEKNYVRRERKYGSFARSFNVADIKTEEIKAEYKDGVLKLDLPKVGEVKPTVQNIEIL